MSKWFDNLKIGKKLAVGFFLVVLVLVILSSIVFVNISNYITANTWNVHTYKVLTELDGIVASMINMETGQRGYSITGDEKFLEPFNKGKSDFDKHFNEVKELTSDNPNQQDNLDKIKQLKESWQQVAENSISLRREVVNQSKVMEDVINEESTAKGKTFMDDLRSVITESANMENALLSERDRNQRSLESSTKMLLIFGTLLAILLAVLIAYYVSKKITSGITKVSIAANKLAIGDMNINIESTTHDEIGELSRSFVTMKESIVNLIREITMLSENAIEGRLSIRGDANKFDGDFRSIVDGVNKTLDAVVQPIKESSVILEQMANANLQIAIEGNYKGDHALIKDAINATIESFNEVLGSISSAADQVASGSKQVSDSSMALSQGATEQASSIEELTASLEEISSQTRLNADNANQANKIAETAKANAEKGNSQMKDMLKAMDEINDASGNISKIIKVIDEIAFQTNILALNAAVEAARAGQHGKGFAVVAEEVRNLAARSASAAKETTVLIEGSIKKVDGGTRIANQTADALNDIVVGVARVANLINDIAVSSNEQATGIAQVNQGILQVSQVVQTNSATSQESAAASEELSSQAELLKQQVSKFKLKRISRSPYKGLEEIDPEIIRVLDSMNDRKKSIPFSTGHAEAALTSTKKIALSDAEFGKYNL